MGRESAGEPIQIATENADLFADLRRDLSSVRKHGRVQDRKEDSGIVGRTIGQ